MFIPVIKKEVTVAAALFTTWGTWQERGKGKLKPAARWGHGTSVVWFSVKFADGEWKIWNVFFHDFFRRWLFEAPRNLENSPQDVSGGCLWTWGMGPLIALFMGKIGETDGEPADNGWQSLNSRVPHGWLTHPEQCPRFHTTANTRLPSLVPWPMFWARCILGFAWKSNPWFRGKPVKTAIFMVDFPTCSILSRCA